MGYMNHTSHTVSSLVHQINDHFGEKVACYTFDAGPNACIFLLEKYVGLVASLLQHFFSDGNGDFLRGNALELESKKELLEALDVTTIPGGLKYVIHTCPGRDLRCWESMKLYWTRMECPINLQFE